MAAANRSTSCWVMESPPPRSKSDNHDLYDLVSPNARHTLAVQSRTHNRTRGTPMTNISIRRAVAADLSQLERLAALDSASPPRGPALVAEADSRMLAALPLGAGRPIADPFEPTTALVQLLELRKSQIDAARRAPARDRGLRSLLRGRLSHA